jgi:Flp pilus assembly protein TadD
MTTDLTEQLRDASELSAIGRDRSALSLLRQLAADHPDSAAVHVHLALALMRSGQASKALREADVALRIGGEEGAAQHIRGAALLRLGRPQAARDALQKAVQSSTQVDARLLSELVHAECANGVPAAALSYADDAVRIEPRSASAHSTRALALLANQRHAEAEQEARQALLIDGGDVQAANNLALAIAAQGPQRLDEARAHLRTAETRSEVMARSHHDTVVRNQRLLGAGDDRRGGMRMAANTMQLRGVVFVILIPIYALVRSPWIIPLLIIAGALLLRVIVYRGFGGGSRSRNQLTALPTVANVTVPAPRRP